ncbi:uncharacterized protein F4812DRAFT_324467 [Daldinia caldariorum]|uniref:uncharacterized protein n=1 Tax=Daldinia caldariorum TaxID=326644 RepID=UPI00200884F8|nr:uncharacterized protein F4812DRAFT_324467 [Daldinia caldariorum]KAI1469281.1 hypothetical protein F4812DRAFT_324467 [Daldinia caldariorum]
MGRWSHLDTDEERLPHGVKRIGYDADDQEYTFFDTSDGSIWVGRYNGPLKCVSRPERVVSSSSDNDSKDEPPRYNNNNNNNNNNTDFDNILAEEEVERRDRQKSDGPGTKALLSTFVAVGRLARLVVARRGAGAARRSPRDECRRDRRAREQAKELLLGDQKECERERFDCDE